MGWPELASSAWIPLRTLPAGTALFHGTDCEGGFETPDGPAWFAFDASAAESWAGWSEAVPPGRVKGARRLFAFETVRDLDLPDTRSEEAWRALCVGLCGDEEAGSRTLAQRVAAAGLSGWYGGREVMLVRPADLLRLIEVRMLEGPRLR